MITTRSTAGHAAEVDALLAGLGVARQRYTGGTLTARSPISGEVVAAVQEIDPNIARNAIDDAHSTFLSWRNVPAPRRGELIRLLAVLSIADAGTFDGIFVTGIMAVLLPGFTGGKAQGRE